MKLDSIPVEVVEDSNTELISLSIVRLGSTGSSSVRPFDTVILPPRGPADAPPSHISPCPEVLLILPGNQLLEVGFLGTAVNADGSVALALVGLCPAPAVPTTMAEPSLSHPPAHEVGLPIVFLLSPGYVPS